MTSQLLRVFMVAVVFATSGLGAALACNGAQAFAGGDHAAHHHGSHGHNGASDASAHDGASAHGDTSLHDHDPVMATAADLSEGDRPDSFGFLDCDGCPHMHAHCCASMAISAGDYGLKLSYATSMLVLEASAPLPLGQLFYPLLRPPSATA